jgi:hypothetical protein
MKDPKYQESKIQLETIACNRIFAGKNGKAKKTEE